ncbi:helix-turn-helix domain-containing protein, partial [Acidobacteria bacterium AH-259-D05]|nr:helix-turn-helix domain-containing protein [Acidobacteria bacterium AH-259-D05]
MIPTSSLTIKTAGGWFAAGREWQRALIKLSDGAFKLFVYASLNAQRATGCFRFRQQELAQVLGKSRRSIGTYLKELEAKELCRVFLSPNQYAAGILQICEEYWPYCRAEATDSLTSLRDEQALYLEAVEALFLSRPCVRSRFSSADRQLASEWFASGIDLALVEQAIVLGCGRKYVSWLNGLQGEPIGSLHYFLPVLEEISKFDLSSEYQSFNQSQVDRLEKQWLASRDLPAGNSKPTGACEKFAQ